MRFVLAWMGSSVVIGCTGSEGSEETPTGATFAEASDEQLQAAMVAGTNADVAVAGLSLALAELDAAGGCPVMATSDDPEVGPILEFDADGCTGESGIVYSGSFRGENVVPVASASFEGGGVVELPSVMRWDDWSLESPDGRAYVFTGTSTTRATATDTLVDTQLRTDADGIEFSTDLAADCSETPDESHCALTGTGEIAGLGGFAIEWTRDTIGEDDAYSLSLSGADDLSVDEVDPATGCMVAEIGSTSRQVCIDTDWTWPIDQGWDALVTLLSDAFSGGYSMETSTSIASDHLEVEVEVDAIVTAMTAEVVSGDALVDESHPMAISLADRATVGELALDMSAAAYVPGATSTADIEDFAILLRADIEGESKAMCHLIDWTADGSGEALFDMSGCL